MPDVITLKALSQFECLGGQCPAHCCGFEIKVDDQTLSNWQARDETRKLLQNLDRKTSCDGIEQQTLRRSDENECTFLDDQGLCRIQLEFGHDCLPEICRTFPRYRKNNTWRSLRSLALSCPEVASLVLFRSGNGEIFERSGGLQSIETLNLPPFEQASVRLDNLIRELLAIEKYPLNAKIYVIATVISDMYRVVDAGQLSGHVMESLCAKPKDKLYAVNLAMKQGKLAPQAEIAGRIWWLIFNFYRSSTNIGDAIKTKQSRIFTYWDKTLATDAEFAEFYELIQTYAVTGREYLRQHFKKEFERYLRLLFMNWGFPWAPMFDNHIAGFLCAYIPFSLTQLLLWIQLDTQGTLCEEDVIKAIYTVERFCGHSENMLSWLSNEPTLLQLETYIKCLSESF